ncbi:Putative KHG/KDPG aldolase [Vibrio stylophorae]|uniref:2-dehydro-3-deoxy-phosphogluconate aldolase n=1 Tax=Vibrio stylophorae TaxID=659351 RepID=A0ABN8DTT0_9VIBR|nr:bifunctional 4-hydroxy-2-oxoglutarate aldolase/2-dehydro-3-deoxy-phosphogluconate aldolase [Vibrio stylophorae]CAH0533748.1 Putative KHG/KDPG aldolase [Vibrio stylophorae]
MKSLVDALANVKIIPVIAIEQAKDIIPIGRALAHNGLPAAEITFRSAAAAEAIARLRDDQPDMLIGAGTVLNIEQAKQAQAAGAQFVVAPGLNPNTVKACQDAQIAMIPGVNNPSTIEQALELGLTTLKFFPAEASGGIAMIKALLAPYQQIQLMPTGGINAQNVQDYLAIDRIYACGGTWMVTPQLIAQKQWHEMGQLARQASQIANNAFSLNLV